MARVERLVVRLADHAARRVELRERLREPDEVLVVGVRRLAPLDALAHERAAVDGAERHVLAADVDVPLGVPRLQLELARRLGDLLEDPVRVELHELALDLLPGGLERRERLGVQEVDAELADDPAPAAVELGHRSLVEDLVPRHLVDQHASASLGLSWTSSLSSAASSRDSPVSRTSSGRPSMAAARSASASSSGVGRCASQTTRS